MQDTADFNVTRFRCDDPSDPRYLLPLDKVVIGIVSSIRLPTADGSTARPQLDVVVGARGLEHEDLSFYAKTHSDTPFEIAATPEGNIEYVSRGWSNYKDSSVAATCGSFDYIQPENREKFNAVLYFGAIGLWATLVLSYYPCEPRDITQTSLRKLVKLAGNDTERRYVTTTSLNTRKSGPMTAQTSHSQIQQLRAEIDSGRYV